MHSAWKKAGDHVLWHGNVSTATLHQPHANEEKTKGNKLVIQKISAMTLPAGHQALKKMTIHSSLKTFKTFNLSNSALWLGR